MRESWRASLGDAAAAVDAAAAAAVDGGEAFVEPETAAAGGVEVGVVESAVEGETELAVEWRRPFQPALPGKGASWC